MKLEWTDPAVEDLTSIRDFIARDSRSMRGSSSAGSSQLPSGWLPSRRWAGRSRVSRGRNPEILFHSYRIIYRREPERIRILTVLHASRDLARREPKPWEVE